jgi:UDP-glucose 4-epimerase
MKITSLVSGGAGFIGSHLVNYLLVNNHEVIVLDDLSGGFEENVNNKARLYIGSITNVKLVNKLFAKYKFDYVYHLAAYAAEGLSHFIRNFNYQNNLIGSINLINASVNNKVKCFVFTSSIAVYGSNALPHIETQKPQPEDPYGIAKYAVEMDLENARKMFGLDYIIFRPHNVYGPNQNIGDKYRNVVGIFMSQILKSKALGLFGDGSQSRAFTYIDDVAPYIANSVNIPEAYHQIFNIGGKAVTTVKELAYAVSDAMKRKVEIKELEERKEAKHSYSDQSKFENIFKPKPETSLEDGLAKMASWVMKNGPRTSKDFNDIEVDKNMPSSWKKQF